MKNSIFIAFFITTSLGINCISGQGYVDYYKAIHKADSLYLLGEKVNTYHLLDSLFKFYEPIELPPYYEFRTYLHTSPDSIEVEEIRKRVAYGISKLGLDKRLFFLNEKSLLNDQWKKSEFTEEQYDSLRKIYIGGIDFTRREKIFEMKIADQKYRSDLNDSISKSLQDSIDDDNGNILKKWFQSGFYPNSRNVGNHTLDKRTAPDILTLLLHTKDSIREAFFIPSVWEFIKKGKADPLEYGAMVDQLHLYNDKEQIYGTYNIKKLEKSKYSLYNKKRKSIGLPSIEYELYRIEKINEKYNIQR